MRTRKTPTKFVQKEPIDLNKQQGKLNELLSQVNACVNRKINDPKALDGFKNAFRKTQPKGLKGGQLKEYQKEALVWMIELAFKKMNGILADDMGLGKTIQTISYFAYLMQEHQICGKHLIICPLTVCNNWQREIKKWMPSLHVEILWGTQEARQHALKTVLKPRKFDVLITPFHSAVFCQQILKKIPWEVLVIDQAHKIKNDEAILTESLRQFESNFKLLLTGTPLSNNLRELWSLLNFIMPDIFYDKVLFDEIEDGIKEHQGDQNEKFEIQCRIAKKFHGIIRPFIMRRTKKDTDLGLPPKTEHTLYVSMTKLQLKLYKNYLKYKNIYGSSGTKNSSNGQMTTRKICNHPYLFEEIEEQGADQYGEHLVENCGKMIVLDKLLDKLINKEKRKILIFSQFKIQLNILEDYCTMRDYNYFRLDGETDIQDRQDMMKNFNEDKNYSIPIFMLSTRAGGLGVNLVSASVVIIYDIDWNPQNDAQAMDRAYRIGQTRPVNVYKMVTEHTIEERMLQVQKYKLIWDQLVIQKGTLMNIKNEDIFSGLNYEKIANMKKGQIFKINARKDNTTIDEIIQMGQVKDEKKYKEIKDKVLKQIQEQKTNQNFNANPFDDHQINDKQGDQMLKKYEGQFIGQKPKKMGSITTGISQKRVKMAFINDIYLPEHYLFQNPDKYKDLIWQIEIKKKQLEQLDGQNESAKVKEEEIENEINDLELKKKLMESEAFMDWQKEEFDLFVNQEKLQFDENLDNTAKLHSLIPTKSSNEILRYKKMFYSIEAKNVLPKIHKIRKDIQQGHIQNKTMQEKKQFFKFLRQNGAVYSKPKAPIENLMNNMRITSEIQDEKQFLESDIYKTNESIQLIREFEGLMQFQSSEEKIVNSKGLLKRLFKNNATTFSDALNCSEANQLIQADFLARKAKILADINRKCFGKQDVSKQLKKLKVEDDQKSENVENMKEE